MSAGRIVAVVFGALLALAGACLLITGVALTVLVRTQTDSAGFIDSPHYRITTPQYAVMSERFDIARQPGDWLPRGLVDLRITAEPETGKELFLGIGPAAAVSQYLAGVGRGTVVDLDARGREITVRQIDGQAPSGAPGDQGFWITSAQGQSAPSLAWDLRPGQWAVVIMNADASAGVDASMSFGISSPVLGPIAYAIILLGAAAAALGGLVLWGAFRSSGAPSQSVAFAFDDVAYPATLYGDIDPEVSRWRWLVKWLLAIPHFVVLGFLWTAYAVLTVIAFFAILFNGRYPRGIFDFNVGVLRWTWRVGFFAFNPAATDRYPPFSMTAGSYPADLGVEYPEHLSRGLVLVKWWLLAIPHYIIVGFFSGGLTGILVLVAMVILLVTGRYPRGLFDLIMGLNRWTLRVTAYATLMRDEYPPFRLDMTPNVSGAIGGMNGTPRMA